MEPLEGVLVCLTVGFVLVLRKVGCDSQYCGAGFRGEVGYSEVWLILRRYMEGLDGWVCIFVNREYGASRVAFGEFVVE